MHKDEIEMTTEEFREYLKTVGEDVSVTVIIAKEDETDGRE